MIICHECGMKVLKRDFTEHMRLHQPVPPVVVANEEEYWRDRISQEILGERLALDFESRPTHHRILEGLELASDLAREGL